MTTDFKRLIEKVKGKKRVDVKTFYRKNPGGSLSKVEHYYKYIDVGEKEEKDINAEDLNPELEGVEAGEEEDYATQDIYIDETISPLEEAALPKIKANEVNDLIKKYKKDKDEAALKQLLDFYSGIIFFHANKYKTSELPYNLIVLEAKRLACLAVNSYDPGKKTNFNTHLTNYLKKLYRFAGDNQNIAKIPEQRIRKINEYKNTLAKLEDRFGREPTDAEVADELSWSLKEVNRLRNELSRADIINFGDDYSYGDLGIMSNKTNEVIRMVYMDSTPDEKFIIEHTYNISGKKQLSLKDIAKKLRVSESKVKIMVSNIKNKILENL